MIDPLLTKLQMKFIRLWFRRKWRRFSEN